MYGHKPIELDLSDVKGGVNTSAPSSALRKDQCQDCLNAILRDIGYQRAPGFLGLKSTSVAAATGYGLWTYERLDGTEILLLMAGTKVYSVSTVNGAATEIFDFGGSAGEAWFANWLDKCWISNGTKLVKIESETVGYQAGISAPSAGPTISAVAGGTLPDGEYNVYIGYARKVSGVNVLYSAGLLLGDITLGTGNNTIRISSFANSADGQVNNKIVWATDAGGSVHYFYHQTNDNTTTTVDVTSNTSKNSALLYSVQAASNLIPASPEYLTVFDKRIWYNVSNVLYYSLQEGNVYDLERFDTDTNYITFPFKIKGIFGLGPHLYINTVAGLIRQPFGDPTARYEMVSTGQGGKPLYFTEFRTVDYWGQNIIGVTNDGVRVFDGERFWTVDLGNDIRPDLNRATNNSAAGRYMSGKVHRRAERTEYLLSYYDTNKGTATICNRIAALNLDKVAIYQNNSAVAPWEFWGFGCNYMTTFKNNSIYYAQTFGGETQISGEQLNPNTDKYVFNSSGALISTETTKEMYVQTRDIIVDIMATCQWIRAHLLIQLIKDGTLTLTLSDETALTCAGAIAPYVVSIPIFDVAVFDEAVFVDESPVVRIIKLPMKMKGRRVNMKISQNANDPNFKVITQRLSGVLTRTRYT